MMDWRIAGGILVGLVVVSVCLGVGLWLQSLQRKSRAERPPVRQKLLRPPGYGLLQRLDALADKFLERIIHMLVTGALLGLVLTVLYPVFAAMLDGKITLGQLVHARGGPQVLSVMIAGLGVLFWALWAVLKAASAVADMRACRLGLRGEQAVAEMLSRESLRKAGYRAFHDVPGDGKWNIDHVVAGPSGVYVLETKTRSLRRATRDQPENEVQFDGRTLRFPWCDDHEAAKQVERNARWVRKLMAGSVDSSIPVQPVIVVPGWFVRDRSRSDVRAMRGSFLLKRLLQAERNYTREQIQPLLSALEERCRTVEF
ncbi:MAG: NERD domain-containing protein [Verrucomicrobiales bacterium]|nr:NERD domain-containing protein [Verrucomicrobiales bacterium]